MNDSATVIPSRADGLGARVIPSGADGLGAHVIPSRADGEESPDFCISPGGSFVVFATQDDRR